MFTFIVVYQQKVRILQRLFESMRGFSSNPNGKESEKTKLALGPIANKLINNDNFKQSLFLYIFRVLKYRKWFPFRTVVAAKRTCEGRNRLPNKRAFISHLKVVYLGNDKRVKGCG